MKSNFLLSFFFLFFGVANAQVTAYVDYNHFKSFLINQNARMEAERILTRQTDSIKGNIDQINSNLLQMTAVRTIILNSFTDVNELLKDGRLMKYQTRLVSDILSETSQIIRMTAEDPEVAVFASESVNSIKVQALELYDEIATFINKGGTRAMMNNGTRDELLRKITQRLQLLRGSLFALHNSLHWKRLYGFWNSLNPFSSWVNQDKRIIDQIIREAKSLSL
ncbi:hypothetical protein [Gaoshiqia sp. Z1-71]|uniref:hypothetical protein n=1 Tax=Gaoshiqia hydrogeniformans TaxID=3290090 RepID=UPI003BF7F831